MTFIGIPFLTGGKGSPIFLTQSMHNTKAQKWILSVAPETSLHKASQLLNLHDIAQQSYYCLQDLAVRPSSKSETVLLTHKMILLVSMEFFVFRFLLFYSRLFWEPALATVQKLSVGPSSQGCILEPCFGDFVSLLLVRICSQDDWLSECCSCFFAIFYWQSLVSDLLRAQLNNLWNLMPNLGQTRAS